MRGDAPLRDPSADPQQPALGMAPEPRGSGRRGPRRCL